MNKSKFMLLITVLVFLVYLTYRSIKEYREDKALGNSITTVGILIDIHTPQGVNGSYYGIIEYVVTDKHYEAKLLNDFSMLKLGDTVQIEYAVEDHSIARLVDRYYMKKNRHLNPDTIPNRQL